MNKKIFGYAAMAVVAAATLAACSDDDNPKNDNTQEAADLDYNSSNAAAWGNYMVQVASLLKSDAEELYESWTESYEGGASFAQIFKTHTSGDYTSASNCIQQIIEGCADIANEVGESKIGDPIAKYKAGQTTAALYAVESWYSWHSIDDYSNNILSIRNSYYGSLNGTPVANSLYTAIKAVDPDLNQTVVDAIDDAYTAIKNGMLSPFRNNIYCAESLAAQEACADLDDVLTYQLKPVATGLDESVLQPIVENFVDAVVLPTYSSLLSYNTMLYNAVVTFKNNPTNNNMASCAQAWLNAREPWETSEAFLFGPVDALNLDPNMDSWPLDQDQIVQILTSGNFDELNWADDDDDDAIEAAQSVRGFHTLEFLIFKDGQARSVE